jgi:predicted MFS family arabinose efflux permease
VIGLLRRHRNFRLLWTGETTSQVGTSVTGIVLPVIAVTSLHASAFTVSLLRAVAWLPWLVIGLLVGAWIDQLREHRGLMIACDFVAAAAFATVPVAWALSDLTALQLILVALAAGTASVFFNTAYAVFLLEVVGDGEERATGNSALQGSASAANVGGPGLGGLLIDLLGATFALLADCASFLVSAVCLAAVRHPPDRPRRARDTAPMRERVREGIRFLRHEPLLRSLTLFGGSSNLALTGYQSILVVFLLRETHLRSDVVGLVLALTGLGGVTGAFLARPLAARLGSARALLATKAAGGAGALLIPLATSPSRAAFVVAGGILVGAGIIAGNIITATFVQSYVPADVFARTSATNNVINYGTIPLGALLGGTLAATVGLTPALWITTAMVPLASVFLFAGPLPGLRDLPSGARRDVGVR